jgi:ATP-dependent RNA helicase RhlE
MFGGVNINPQIDACAKASTSWSPRPAACSTTTSRSTLDLSYVEILVLDEADRMLDMGFIRDIKKVLAMLPAKKQNLLFSATFSTRSRPWPTPCSPARADRGRPPQRPPNHRAEGHPVDREQQARTAGAPDQVNNWHQVLVFTRMKHGANRLAEQL